MLGIVGAVNLHKKVTVLDPCVLFRIVVNAVGTAHSTAEVPLVKVDGVLVELVVPDEGTTHFFILEAEFFSLFFHNF